MSLKASKTTLTFLLCFGFAISSGCKSLEFGKPKLPKLPSLAFWKKGDAELPPPPARHFDPSRFGDGAETQLAEATDKLKSGSTKFDQYGMRVDDAVDEAGKLASEKMKFSEEKLQEFASKPIRKPYGLDDLDSDKMLSKTENKFNLDTAGLKDKLDQAKAATSNQLSSTQQDFQSAMKSAADLKETAKGSLSAQDNSFPAGNNSFAAAPIAETMDAAKGFGNVSGGSFLPKSNGFGDVKLTSGESADGTKGPLYDAKGRLVSAKSKVDSFNTDKMKSEFEKQLLARQSDAKAKADALKIGAAKAGDQLNSFASNTQDLKNQAFPKVASDGSLIPQTQNRPVDLNTGSLALQPNNSPLLKINKPNTLANSFSASPSTQIDPIAQMRSEIEALKAQVAAAKQSAIPSGQPVERMAQNTIEGFVLPLNQVNDAFNPKAGSPMANQLQGQSVSPASTQPRAPNTPTYQSNPDANSFYPATPYGGFGSAAKPNSGVGQAGFNSANDFQNQVTQASVDEPANTYSGPLQANRIDSNVTEVLIPSAVLSGSSSFSPGSTRPLQ